MRRIAIINQKGGVGKTTTTVNIAAALAESGARVLTIDLDPQGHLTLHLGVEVSDEQPGMYDVLTSGSPMAEAGVVVRERLSHVPADIDLAAAESELISVTGREVLLREAVDAVAHQYDYLLIDCPPSLGVLTINALVASEEVIIPLQSQFFALQGLSRLFDTVMLVKQRINPTLSVSGVVLCMHESQTRLGNEVVDDLNGFLESARGSDVPWAEAVIYKTCIRRNIKLAEASSFGQTIFEYAPRSNGALDYADLTDEIFGARAELVTPETRTRYETECARHNDAAKDAEAHDAPALEVPDGDTPVEAADAGKKDTRHGSDNGRAKHPGDIARTVSDDRPSPVSAPL